MSIWFVCNKNYIRNIKCLNSFLLISIPQVFYNEATQYCRGWQNLQNSHWEQFVKLLIIYILSPFYFEFPLFVFFGNFSFFFMFWLVHNKDICNGGLLFHHFQFLYHFFIIFLCCSLFNNCIGIKNYCWYAIETWVKRGLLFLLHISYNIWNCKITLVKISVICNQKDEPW